MVGLAAEARVAARFGGLVQAGGGTPEGAARAASRLIADGVTGLVSFGLAGGLDSALRPGAVIVPQTVNSGGTLFVVDAALAERFGGVTPHIMLAGTAVVATEADKHRLYKDYGVHAVDLESGAVAMAAAAAGLPFVVVRAICDPAERDLPAAALVALDPRGRIGLIKTIGSLLHRPGQLPDLLAVARDAHRARRSLLAISQRFGAKPS